MIIIVFRFLHFFRLDNDFSKYPTLKFQLKWIKEYLNAKNNSEASEKEISDFQGHVELFSVASMIYWGIWALVQAEISSIDFDYMNFAKARLDEFKRRKNELMRI